VVQITDASGNAVAQAGTAITAAIDVGAGGTLGGTTVVVTNASTRFTQCGTDDHNPPFFSCFGKPQDDSGATAYQLDIAVG